MKSATGLLIKLTGTRSQTEIEGLTVLPFIKEELEDGTSGLFNTFSETDRYGRALRYVWLQKPPSEPSESDVRERMFNARLMAEGYAESSSYPMDVKYQDKLREL